MDGIRELSFSLTKKNPAPMCEKDGEMSVWGGMKTVSMTHHPIREPVAQSSGGLGCPNHALQVFVSFASQDVSI